MDKKYFFNIANFRITKKVSKPVLVEFYTKIKRKIIFKKIKKVSKPVKVEFYKRLTK